MPTQERVHLGLARTYQILTLFPRETLIHNVVLSLLGLDQLRWNPWSVLTGAPRSLRHGARGAGAGRARRQRRAHRGRDLLWRAAPARARHGAGAEAEGAAARRAARRPLAGRAADRARAARHHPARRDHRHDRARHGHRARLCRAHHACCTTARSSSRARAPRWSPTRAPGRSTLATDALDIAGIDAYLRRQPCAARRLVLAAAGPAARPARPQRRRQDHLHVARSWASSSRGAARSASTASRSRGLAPDVIARKGICLVPQGRRMFRTLTVRENLMVAAQPRKNGGDAPAGRSTGCSSCFRGWPSVTPRSRARSPAASSRCWRSAAR